MFVPLTENGAFPGVEQLYLVNLNPHLSLGTVLSVFPNLQQLTCDLQMVIDFLDKWWPAKNLSTLSELRVLGVKSQEEMEKLAN